VSLSVGDWFGLSVGSDRYAVHITQIYLNKEIHVACPGGGFKHVLTYRPLPGKWFNKGEQIDRISRWDYYQKTRPNEYHDPHY
jgi:hypothetical protein